MPQVQRFVSLEEMPTSPAERRIAVGLVVALLILALASPFLPGRSVTFINGPSFLTAYDLLTALCDIVTGFLVAVQFRQTRSVLLLCLAGGYFFTGTMAAVHLLTIPGLLFTGNLVGATRNSSLIIRAFWMVGQPAGAITALLTRRFHPAPVQRTKWATVAVVAFVAALAASVLTMATLGVDLMPDLTIETGSWRVSYVFFLPVLVVIQATAVTSVFLTSRGRTALTLWLTLALFSGMVETAIGWWFVGFGLAPARRYSLFFYIARIGGMLSTSLLLLVLLQQIAALYGRMIAAFRSLQTSEQRLIEQQRMEAVGRLAGGVAHDFNNLLMVITGNLEMLHKVMPDEGQRRLVETALRAAHRGGNLTRRILTFARRQMLVPAPHDINQVLHDMQDLIRSAADSLVTVVNDLQAEASVCAIDRGEFELAVLNIVVNARHAMPSGGTLTIETRTVAIAAIGPAVEPGADLAPGGYLRVRFTDSGAGMPPEVLSRAFEPFFTTRVIGEGSGLGLSQVLGFARQSGGDATLASAPGRGASVAMYLPLTSATSQRDQEGGERQSRKLDATVVVVEDAADVRDTVVRILTNQGCKVLRAADARSGLAIVEQYREELDLLLTDIVMPGGMNGTTLADLASQRCPRLPILLMTGYADQPVDAGGRTVLRKPFDEAELVETMQRVLTRRSSGGLAGSDRSAPG
jgi:signal transduction histidine kinase/ActR/RegA family two-component response regulator